MPGLDDWLNAARSADPDDLREQILTGFRAGKPFTPYVPTLAMPSPLRSVLDFGCGLGRNFPYLTAAADAVTGFDLEPMIAVRALAPTAGGGSRTMDDVRTHSSILPRSAGLRADDSVYRSRARRAISARTCCA